ncbi:hypothetical protein EB796_011535 [Bugula neritina]|uniref:Uncharacterized protein n=1 Tax=Bugula neritina TaxID=10212 RepID=A0A7J7JW26_BUGNE|nr:hypothetical protein EB796_011535 [Bugula neritina]
MTELMEPVVETEEQLTVTNVSEATIVESDKVPLEKSVQEVELQNTQPTDLQTSTVEVEEIPAVTDSKPTASQADEMVFEESVPKKQEQSTPMTELMELVVETEEQITVTDISEAKVLESDKVPLEQSVQELQPQNTQPTELHSTTAEVEEIPAVTDSKPTASQADEVVLEETVPKTQEQATPMTELMEPVVETEEQLTVTNVSEATIVESDKVPLKQYVQEVELQNTQPTDLQTSTVEVEEIPAVTDSKLTETKPSVEEAEDVQIEQSHFDIQEQKTEPLEVSFSAVDVEHNTEILESSQPTVKAVDEVLLEKPSKEDQMQNVSVTELCVPVNVLEEQSKVSSEVKPTLGLTEGLPMEDSVQDILIQNALTKESDISFEEVGDSSELLTMQIHDVSVQHTPENLTELDIQVNVSQGPDKVKSPMSPVDESMVVPEEKSVIAFKSEETLSTSTSIEQSFPDVSVDQTLDLKSSEIVVTDSEESSISSVSHAVVTPKTEDVSYTTEQTSLPPLFTTPLHEEGAPVCSPVFIQPLESVEEALPLQLTEQLSNVSVDTEIKPVSSEEVREELVVLELQADLKWAKSPGQPKEVATGEASWTPDQQNEDVCYEVVFGQIDNILFKTS